MLPLGIRSNNPLNLRPSNPPWQGQVGVNEKGFAIFDTMVNGIRAPAKNLIAYYDKYGIKTVRQAITRWSTTDQAAYISYVCMVLNCQPDDEFNFRDPSFLFWEISAQGEFENSHDSFTEGVSDADITEGVREALV